MNPNCKKELSQANNINEMVIIINKYYDLDQNFGQLTGAIVKAKVTENFTSIIQKLNIKERQTTQQNKRSLF